MAGRRRRAWRQHGQLQQLAVRISTFIDSQVPRQMLGPKIEPD
jgi:hypothetical protein